LWARQVPVYFTGPSQCVPGGSKQTKLGVSPE
jgi:hypothetical protein